MTIGPVPWWFNLPMGKNAERIIKRIPAHDDPEPTKPEQWEERNREHINELNNEINRLKKLDPERYKKEIQGLEFRIELYEKDKKKNDKRHEAWKLRHTTENNNEPAGLEKVYPNDPNVAAATTMDLNDSRNKPQTLGMSDNGAAGWQPQTLETMFAERDKKREQQMLKADEEQRKREQRFALANVKQNKKWSIV